MRVRASKTGYEIAEQTIALTSDATLDFTLLAEKATPAPILSGHVRDTATGRGVASAEVESIQGVNVGRGVRTDSNGAYRLDELTPGSMR